MNIEEILKKEIKNAITSLFAIDAATANINLQNTKKEFKGTYTFVTFSLSSQLKKKPEEIATLIGDYLTSNTDTVAGYNIVKGFLNIEIADNVWKEIFALYHQSLDQLGVLAANGQKVMVEYSSPNTNKPLHLGHLRNNFLGYSLAQILEACGYEVVKANLINDRGIHICKSMIAYQLYGNNETPEQAGIKGDHLVGKYYVRFDQEMKNEIQLLKEKGLAEDEAKKQAPILLKAQELLRKWEEQDPDVIALWTKMNTWVYAGFEATYTKIGVSFDRYYYESDTYLLGKDIVAEGLKNNVFFQKEDGSVWIDLTEEGLDQKLVQRGDGTSVYITQDMGTADLKYNDYHVDKSIYVVGNEQDYHFDVLKKIMLKLGRPYADGIYHMSYGMVDLPSGKMKSREGTVVDADDLVNEMIDTAKDRTNELGKIDDFTSEEAEKLYHQLALGALKYFILKVDPKKRMLFNPEESVDFQGNTGPFIQYTHARIAALLRKADELALDYKASTDHTDYPLSQVEADLILQISIFSKKIKEAGEQYSPAVIAQYVYDLAKEFNRFYAETSIFKADNADHTLFRIKLSYVVAKAIQKAMRLLGVEVPSRM